MVTYKSLKIFENEGITYLGIPEDMIIDFLHQVTNTSKIRNNQLKAVLIEKLGIVAAVKAELDETQADLVDSTMMQQIMESDKPTTERADWVKNPIVFVPRSQYYRYTNDNLVDLNAKLKIPFRLSWVFNIISKRHPGIEMKFDHLEGKINAGKTVIRIPKNMVDAAKVLLDESMQALATVSVNDIPINNTDAPVETTRKSQKITIMQEDANQKEIAELVLMIMEREKTINMASLKQRLSREMNSESITFDAFSKILRNLEVSGFIIIEGTTIILK